jgi:hypothetical protein
VCLTVYRAVCLTVNNCTIFVAADAEIPEDPDVALRDNAMKITRTNAVEQVNKIIALVEDMAATTIKNSVIGEELRTNAAGAKMIIAK